MSQAGKIILVGGGGGGPIGTLEGNTGGLVYPTGAGTINVVGDESTITTTGNLVANTLTAGLSTYTVETIDDSNTVLGPVVSLINNQCITISAQVVGAYEIGLNAGIGGLVMATARKDGANPVALVQGTSPIATMQTGGTASSFTIVALDNTIFLQVTGEDAININWTAIVTYIITDAP